MRMRSEGPRSITAAPDAYMAGPIRPMQQVEAPREHAKLPCGVRDSAERTDEHLNSGASLTCVTLLGKPPAAETALETHHSPHLRARCRSGTAISKDAIYPIHKQLPTRRPVPRQPIVR